MKGGLGHYQLHDCYYRHSYYLLHSSTLQLIPPTALVCGVLTDGFHKSLKEAVREERLRQLPEKHLQCSGDNMDVLPLAVVQIQLLFWENTRRNGTTGFNETITRH